jgi:DNA-binding MarR family transcriptional regulator
MRTVPSSLLEGPATIDPTMESATPTAPGSMVLLTRLSRLVYRRASEAALGMTLKEYMALNTLRDQHNLTQQALGDALHLDANNCVLLLNALEAGHLAERRRDRTDRRRHIVELTPAGREAVERADRAFESLEAEVLGALSPEERATLRRLLGRALESE